MTSTERQPTKDEQAGIDWWNAMPEHERAAWLEIAKSAKPADAWAAYKASFGPGNYGAKTP